MGTTIGRAYFEGNQPSNCRSIGNIQIYYNGTFPNSNMIIRGVEHYKFQGDVWVVYGPFYEGYPKIKVTTTCGTVQVGWA